MNRIFLPWYWLWFQIIMLSIYPFFSKINSSVFSSYQFLIHTCHMHNVRANYKSTFVGIGIAASDHWSLSISNNVLYCVTDILVNNFLFCIQPSHAVIWEKYLMWSHLLLFSLCIKSGIGLTGIQRGSSWHGSIVLGMVGWW